MNVVRDARAKAQEDARAKALEVKKKAEYFGAGLGGLALFGAVVAHAFEHDLATRVLRAVFLTLALLAGVMAFFAWSTATSIPDEPKAADVNSAVNYINTSMWFICGAGVALVATACVAVA